MAVFKFSNVSGFKNYQRYNDFLAGNPAVNPDRGSYFPLAIVTLSSTQTTIDFNNIPQTYTHLQIRMMGRGTASGSVNAALRINNDTGSFYTSHYVSGDGASMAAGVTTVDTTPTFLFRVAPNTASASIFGTAIVDILDYRNTNKNKVSRSLSGYDNNGSGSIMFISQLYKKTNAITRLEIVGDSAFEVNSTFALYGVLA